MVTPKDIIKTASGRLSERSLNYKLFRDYYEGNHRLAFSTESFRTAFWRVFREFCDNLCGNVVDAVVDRAEVLGFTVEEGDETLPKTAWEIWQRNRMDVRGVQVLIEALRCGDAYVLVWPGEDNSPMLYPQQADICTVEYDAENPGNVLWAVKRWQDPATKKVRVNIYHPDRIEKFLIDGQTPKPYAPAGENSVLPNPYGVVPVFHFSTNADIGQFGKSELKNVIPLQDALNKSIIDMLVGSETHALPQRWVTGLDLEVDPTTGKVKAPFTAGVDKVWAIESPDAKFGQFDAADLAQLVTVSDMFRLSVARVSRTPLHYLTPHKGDFPSGEALRTAETPFVKKVKRYTAAFGNVWEDVMKLALRIQGGVDSLRLSTQWSDPAAESPKEKLDALTTKQGLGVSNRQLLIEAGYGETDVERIMEEKAAERDASTSQFNAGFAG
jgi:Phage portal protein, SPP1 Gp6-like